MPRPRGSGLTVTRAVLADGTVREYCYNRYTGEKLGNNRQLALAKLAKSVGPLSAYDESINALIRDYLKSNSFLSKRGTTQGLYRHYLRLISNRFGTRHANSITFAEVDALKTELRNTPSKANMALAVLRILLGRGVKLGFCQVNTAARPGRVRQFPREQIWEVADEERFLAAASARMRLAFMLLLYTVQRPSDMLAMTRDAIIERNGRLYLTLRQQKTGTLVDIPVHRRLAETLQHDLSHASKSRFLVAEFLPAIDGTAAIFREHGIKRCTWRMRNWPPSFPSKDGHCVTFPVSLDGAILSVAICAGRA